MDASTTAAAALAIAIAASEQSAMEALLLERERLAMVVEDQASFMAQRHWTSMIHHHQLYRPMTWRELYDQRHSEAQRAWAIMRAALGAHDRGEPEVAERLLRAEVSSDAATSEEGEEEEEEEEEEENMEVDVEVSPP